LDKEEVMKAILKGRVNKDEEMEEMQM